MNGIENVRSVARKSSEEAWLDAQDREALPETEDTHELDRPQKRRLHRRLLEWYELERQKQAVNRYQMALDQDFYDGLQWSEEDAQEVSERGQAPLVFNEIKPTIDWLIGTEKRTRMDFRVFPREEDDVKGALVKTKVLKYVGDVNKAAFARSRAFADAIKVGVGWIESGVRADPTEDPIYTRYEDWRNILYDSSSVELDLSDARYLFRVRWTDLDIALAMFPERAGVIRKAAVAANLYGQDEEEDFWYLGQRFTATDEKGHVFARRTFVSDAGLVNNRRERVKLIEAWYRAPERCQVCMGPIFDGKPFNPADPIMRRAYREGVISVYDAVKMRVRCAVMTEGGLLQEMASPYRHDRFPFTPVWCYRRGRDRMPYGVIRNLRDPQEDLNKRASKALWLFSSRRVTADHDALEGTGMTWDDLRYEAARPDSLFIKKRGSELKVEADLDVGQWQLRLMEQRAFQIQKSGGVTDENLGRQTNATSGEAIKARQNQGSMVTTEPFDNLRFAMQLDGEIQLSLVEQFYTTPKKLRITASGQPGKQFEFVEVNQPELQPDGTVRFINDITARQADFVVDEVDFAETLRRAMFESLAEVAGRFAQLNAEAGLRLLRMSIEYSDLPNKEEMVAELRKIIGEPPPQEELTPEQQAQLDERAQKQQMVEDLAIAEKEAAVAERQAKVRKLNAEAERILAELETMGQEDPAFAEGVRSEVEEVKRQAADQLMRMQQKLVELKGRVAEKNAALQAMKATKKEI